MKVLTANRLGDGESVWYSAEGWVRSFEQSKVADTPDAENHLTTIGALAFANNEVVDVNLIDVAMKDGKLVAQRLRERIRADGPTIEYISKTAA